jgi:hypothetical protein
MNDVALLYRTQGKYNEAGSLFIKVLEGRRRLLGSDHRDTIDARIQLSWIRILQKKYADAEPLLREALTGSEKTIPDSWLRYYSQSMLGVSLAGQQRYAEAESMLLSGYQGMLRRQATIPADSRSALDQVGTWVAQLHRH